MMAEIKDQLARAQMDIQAQIGTFLQTGQRIMVARDRALAYKDSENATVRGKAQAISSQASGLLTNFNNIETAAGPKIAEAMALKTQMESDPTWKAILSADVSNLGWDTLQKVQLKIGAASSVVNDLLNLKGRMDSHIKEVVGLESDVKDLASYAQGKGILPKLTGVTAGLEASMSKVAVILGVGLAAWLFLPSLLPRMASSVRKAAQR